MGFVVGVIFVCVGLFVVVPAFGLFGLLWTGIAVAITVVNGMNTFGKKGVSTMEIYTEEEEPKPDSQEHQISTNTLDAKGRLEQLESLKKAGLLTQEEYDTLTASAMAVADQYGCGVYVVTVDDMADYIDPDAVTETGETGMAAFTEYAWDALGLAASHDSNGIMLALSMAERDFQMLAHGDTANAAFTDYGKYIMQDEFLDNFREDDWYGGFADYIAACGRYLEANANGAPIDVEPSDETEEEYEPLSFGDKLFFAALMAFRFGLPLGLIVAFIVCAVYKRQLKSVRRATEAARYTVSGGAEITAREDRFTHTTEVRTPIKTESDDHDSDPSFSGGTTVNSGGFSHSGGKF